MDQMLTLLLQKKVDTDREATGLPQLKDLENLRETQWSLRLLMEVSGHSGKIFDSEWQPCYKPF